MWYCVQQSVDFMAVGILSGQKSDREYDLALIDVVKRYLVEELFVWSCEQMKKLLVTASTFPRWEGDTEPRFVLDLLSHMTDQFQITVLVPASPGAKEREILEGVNVIRYHYFPIHRWETLCYPGAIIPRIKEKKVRGLLIPFLLISLFFHLWKLLPNYDIVHAHWLIPQGIVQSFFRKPYIVTGHGGDVTLMNKRISKRLKIRCLKRAKQVTVVSEHLKSKVQELMPEIDLLVIPMGVDISKFGKQYYVPDYFGQGNKKVVLFVGRLAEKKGVTYLIDAMKNIDALLVIVGDGPLREKLQRKAVELKSKVRFLGAKTHEELKAIYASADIFVAPSITAEDGDQEGLPTAIMEAMASGLPVVASNSGGIAGLIDQGVNGILCEEKDVGQLAQAVATLCNNKAYREKMTEAAAAMIGGYDYRVIAKKYSDILNEIVLSRKVKTYELETAGVFNQKRKWENYG